MGEALCGLVLRSTGSWYSVEHGGLVYGCRTRGRIRLAGVRSTNPVAVGDWVHFRLDGDGVGVIESVVPRRNYMIRRATNLSRAYHVIGANLDQVAVVVTLRTPATPLLFVDRFLATACAYGIPSLVVFAKQDLAAERDALAGVFGRRMYEGAGCVVLEVSAESGAGLEAFREAVLGRTTLLAGNSGVGKSSLLNALCPSLGLRTGPLSPTHGLGQHTTTFSEMHGLGDGVGTRVIDTPGIKGFGVVEFARGEVSHYFPEIFALGRGCRYGDCVHDGEPGCAVRAGVEGGVLPVSRYESYLSLLRGDDDKYRM